MESKQDTNIEPQIKNRFLKGIEIMAVREQLNLSVDQIIQEFGFLSRADWLNFEKGHTSPPKSVLCALTNLASLYSQLRKETLAYYDQVDNHVEIKYYTLFMHFIEDIPHATIIGWRLHQALVKNLSLESHIMLSETAPAPEEGNPLLKTVTAEALIMSEMLLSDGLH